MKNSGQALLRGLAEFSVNQYPHIAQQDSVSLGRLAMYAAWLVEGTPDERKHARAAIKKLVGRGRCLLNAEELKQREIGGSVK